MNGANVPDVFVADEIEWIRKFISYMKEQSQNFNEFNANRNSDV